MAIKLEPARLFQITIISFAIIEGISFLLSKLSPDISFIRGGFVLILLLVVVFFTTLFNIGINITSLKIKDIILMLVVLIIVVALYFLLPLAIPQIFSIIPGNEINTQLRSFFTSTLGSVLGVGSGVV